MARLPDLGWIRVFIEVARLGSLSGAAKALNITQPAVSYQIRSIEEEFGASLLRRHPRGVDLTEAGRELFAILAPALTQVDRLAARLRPEPRRQALRVLTDYAFASLWLIPRLHLFREAHPDTDIEVVAARHSDLGQLGAGDVAVVFGAAADLPAGAELLLVERVVPVCAPGLVAAETDPLGHARLIHLNGGPAAPWFSWAEYLAKSGIARAPGADRGNLFLNTDSLVIDAALAGQGVALGWRGLIDALVARGALCPAGPELTAPGRGYFLLQGPGEDPAAALLRTWFFDCMAGA